MPKPVAASSGTSTMGSREFAGWLALAVGLTGCAPAQLVLVLSSDVGVEPESWIGTDLFDPPDARLEALPLVRHPPCTGSLCTVVEWVSQDRFGRVEVQVWQDLDGDEAAFQGELFDVDPSDRQPDPTDPQAVVVVDVGVHGARIPVELLTP